MDDAGAGNVRAVLKAAARAADLADRLREAEGRAAADATSLPVAS